MRETDVVYVDRPSHLMSFAFKWLDKKQFIVRTLADYPGYKKHPRCDKALCQELHKLLTEADLLVGHNSDSFDIKKANSRFLYHRLPVPAPYKTFDTLKAARKTFRFDSNKLDTLSQTLFSEKKLPNTGINLWVSCLNGDLRAWKIMAAYNKRDVVLLEKLYLEVRPWSNHPNLNLLTGHSACPTCQSMNVQARGLAIAKTRKRQRFQCQACGSWWSEALKK